MRPTSPTGERWGVDLLGTHKVTCDRVIHSLGKGHLHHTEIRLQASCRYDRNGAAAAISLCNNVVRGLV